MATSPLIGVSFAGTEFQNADTSGVEEKLKQYLQIPVLRGLGGEFAELDAEMETAIIDEIMAGCGSSLAIATRPKCGNLRHLLQILTDAYLEKLQEGIAVEMGVVTPPTAAIKPAGPEATGPTAIVGADACPLPVEITSNWVSTTVERVNFPVLDMSGNYYEFQNDSSSCGRRALNNLLGGKVYDASIAVYDSGATYTFDGLTQVSYPIDLHQLCRTLLPDISNAQISPEPGYCRRDEFHDINLLIAALHMAGYTATVQPTDILKDPTKKSAVADLLCTPPNTTLVGYFMNHGKAHWVAAKKIGDSYQYFDSMVPKNKTLFTEDSFLAYLREPRVVQIVKVLLPNGSTYIDPRKLLQSRAVAPAVVLQETANAKAIGDLKADSLRQLDALMATYEEGSEERALQPVLAKAIRTTSDPAQDIGFHTLFAEQPEALLRVFSDAEARGLLLAIREENGNYSENVLAVLMERVGRAGDAGTGDAGTGAADEVAEAGAAKGPLLFRIRLPLHLLLSE